MNISLKKIAVAVTAGLVAVTMTACAGGSDAKHSSSASASSGKKILVFATTGYLADAVKNIAPDADIYTMVKPGGDPHTYNPSTEDIEKMKKADAVIWNGLHLEAHMVDQLKSNGEKQFAAGESVPQDMLLPWIEDGKQDGYDPHIWNNVKAWAQISKNVGDFLGKRNPAKAEEYKKNAETYANKIDEAAKEAHKLLDPLKGKTLITGHDAFNYLGKEFGINIEATDFVSSEAEKSATQMKELADKIAKEKIPTIFVDNTQNPQAIKSLEDAVKAAGWNVKVAEEELYADSLGDKTPVDTYLGVLKHNAEAIAKGLSK